MLERGSDRPRALVVGSWPHVPGHLSSGSAAALRALGYEVAVHDPLRSCESLGFKLWNRARLCFKSMRCLIVPGQNRALLAEVRRFEPGLVLVIRGEMFTARTLEEIRRTGAVTVNWCPDDPFQKGTELEAAAAYHHVFVFDPHYIPVLARAGARRVHYLSMACDPEVHRPLGLAPEERTRYGADVSFVGTRYGNREDVLARLTSFDLAVWGGGWKVALARPGHPLRAAYRGLAMGSEMVKIYNASRVVLNIQHPQSVHAQNMRTFEAAACGALTITPYTRELPRLFEIGQEIVDFRQVGELIEKTRYYLAHPDEAAEIGARGRERAARDHSYQARMQELLSTVEMAAAVRAA